jgi:mannose-6-phosphate isomerase-like protein (cupin superfamily)
LIIQDSDYMIRSANSNTGYWEQGTYPPWTAISFLAPMPNQKKGAGVEPHYHDNDEIWLFTSGRGEVWLDGQSFPVTPNTLVYTPMGVVHRFQMFTDFANVPIVTPLERQRRATHLVVEEEGPPVPTVPGFVIPGGENTGPFATRGRRCPFGEIRVLDLPIGAGLDERRLAANEHYAVMSGRLRLRLPGLAVELAANDVALLRTGAVRQLDALTDAQVALVRE